MKLEKRKHHSTGDWNVSSTNWTLDSAIYVSAPSSIRNTTALEFLTALVKTVVVPIANVKEGRIVTCGRFRISFDRIHLIFRYQDANNYYEAMIEPLYSAGYKTVHIRRVLAGVTTTLMEASVTISLNTWYQFRVTWWNDYVGLVIRLEYWTGTAWVKLLDDAYDSLNYWKDVGGRVGLGLYTYEANYWTNADDTEIYGIG